MRKLNIMFIGAHPDDCDLKCGATAIMLSEQGHKVLFLSMTDGRMGHHVNPGPVMAVRRKAETQAVAALCGIEYLVLEIPDGALTTELKYRDMLLREIRAFTPDIIITHRPNDYHPDHRNTGILVMDCSYLVIVPGITPDRLPMKKAPYIFYMYDFFTFPGPFKPDIAVNIDSIMDKKTDMLNCHSSQMYEWLPWVGDYSDEVPSAEDNKGRLAWLKTKLEERGEKAANYCRELLIRRYGDEKGSAVKCCEAFQLCEYGSQPMGDDLMNNLSV